MMPDARRRFGRQQIAPGRLEEIHHRLGFERRGVGYINHRLRARERGRQPFSRERVDARVRRGGQHFVAALTKKGYELGADEARATNHDDLHVITPAFDPAKCWLFEAGRSYGRGAVSFLMRTGDSLKEAAASEKRRFFRSIRGNSTVPLGLSPPVFRWAPHPAASSPLSSGAALRSPRRSQLRRRSVQPRSARLRGADRESSARAGTGRDRGSALRIAEG